MKGRWVVGIVMAVVVVLVVVSATILTAVYLGTRVTENNFKVNWSFQYNLNCKTIIKHIHISV